MRRSDWRNGQNDKKADKNAKPGFFARAGKWFRDMKSELKKVQWPTRKQTINNTLIVIACVIVVGILSACLTLWPRKASNS